MERAEQRGRTAELGNRKEPRGKELRRLFPCPFSFSSNPSFVSSSEKCHSTHVYTQTDPSFPLHTFSIINYKTAARGGFKVLSSHAPGREKICIPLRAAVTIFLCCDAVGVEANPLR